MSDSPYISNVSVDTFNTEVIERSFHTPVLVDFWAGWCNPCKMLMPILSKLAEEYQGQFFLAKVDSDVERDLATNYGVRSLPTVKVFKQGQIVDEFAGVIPEANIRALIEKYLTRESDGLFNEAYEAMKNNDLVQARTLMEKAYALDPDRKNIILGMAEISLLEGNADEADKLIASLPINQQNDEDVEQIKAKLMFASAAGKGNDIANLEQQIASNPKDVEALKQLGACYVISGEFEKALECYLQLLIIDKEYQEGLPRKSILAIFNLLGGSGPLVNRYRSKMASALH